MEITPPFSSSVLSLVFIITEGTFGECAASLSVVIFQYALSPLSFFLSVSFCLVVKAGGQVFFVFWH